MTISPVVQQEKKKVLAGVGIAVFVLLLITILVAIYRGGAGQAIFIAQQPQVSEVNLVQEKSVIFTALPQDGQSTRRANVTIALYPFACDGNNLCDGQESIISCPMVCQGISDPSGLYQYEFNVTRPDANTFHFAFTDRQGQLAAEDQFMVGVDDTTPIYLDELDDIPDVEVKYSNNQIEITNLHYHSTINARIWVSTVDEAPAAPIIYLRPGESLDLTVNATTDVASPTLTATLQSVAGVSNPTNLLPNPAQNVAARMTSGIIQWTAPQQSAAYTLTIQASVTGVNEITTAQYTIAVGGLLYYVPAVSNKFPELKVANITVSPTVEFNVTLAGTRERQSFALPCMPTTDVAQFFMDSQHQNVYRLLGYDAQQQGSVTTIRTGGIPPLLNQISQWELFKGYLLQLQNPMATQVSITCPRQEAFIPTGKSPSPNEQTLLLPAGWNLISIPGVVPYALEEYLRSGTFNVYECPQGSQCSNTPLPAGTKLWPGRTYWVYADNALTLRYRVG